MLQCQDCEYFKRGPEGQISFACDPFSTIKEPECLAKWQLIKLDLLTHGNRATFEQVKQQRDLIEKMVSAYEATLEFTKRLAPMQEKMFRHMEREIEDIEEADQWKYQEDEDEGPGDDEEPDRF